MEREIERIEWKDQVETLNIELCEGACLIAKLDHSTHRWTADLWIHPFGVELPKIIRMNRREAEAFFGHQSCNRSPDCVPEQHFFKDFRYVE